MPITLQMEKFSGPLDLLLSLIQDEKLAINEVAISKVTEQFLSYLDTLEERRAEELADFLVVASRLLLLKSRLLLPQFATTDEDDGASLEDQLRLYQQFVKAAKHLNALWERGEQSVFRMEPPRKAEGFVPPKNVSLSSLHERMVQLVTRLAPPKPLPQTRIDKAISVKQKIDEIRRVLAGATEVSFHTLLKETKNKTEVIMSFLAILELVKEQAVFVKQEEGFGDIVIQKL